MPDGREYTVVVVPRERFGFALEALDRLRAATPGLRHLVYVDGGSPARVRRGLEARASEPGFTLLRRPSYLSPNAARNIGLRHVTTEFAIFVDNDVVFDDGWVEPLVRCARETGATVVAPKILIEIGGRRKLHAAGGIAKVLEQDGRRVLLGVTYDDHNVSESVSATERLETESAEFHGVLIRTDFLERTGGFDEALLSFHDHVDLSLAVREAGGTIYYEPNSVVTYVTPSRLERSDLAYYCLRWSERWNRSTRRHFVKKWRLDARSERGMLRWTRHHRLRGLRLVRDRAVLTRAGWVRQRFVLLAERLFNIAFASFY